MWGKKAELKRTIADLCLKRQETDNPVQSRVMTNIQPACSITPLHSHHNKLVSKKKSLFLLTSCSTVVDKYPVSVPQSTTQKGEIVQSPRRIDFIATPHIGRLKLMRGWCSYDTLFSNSSRRSKAWFVAAAQNVIRVKLRPSILCGTAWKTFSFYISASSMLKH